ncbi:MAG: LexA family transcriptional regulator [Planctomycetota bacterium]|nr:LexA family transcriptional regulator [Planctomycetota bacterium]
MPAPSISRYVGRVIYLTRREKGMRQSELALLTGLKQPNLSRIENGLVTPRQATLDRIAKALGVDPQVFFSESKMQEVERKWAGSLGPKHAALLLAGKLTPVPLLDTTAGYPTDVNAKGEPQAPLEVVLQLLPLTGEAEGACRFALRAKDDSMQAPGSDTFKPGEVVVFSGGVDVKPGDFVFVIARQRGLFRRLEVPDPDNVRLVPVNPAYPTDVIPRAEIKGRWKLVLHLRGY